MRQSAKTSIAILFLLSCQVKRKYYLVRTYKEFEILSSTKWIYRNTTDSFYAPTDVAAYDTAVLMLSDHVQREKSLNEEYPGIPGWLNETTNVDVYNERGQDIKQLIPAIVADSIEKMRNIHINHK